MLIIYLIYEFMETIPIELLTDILILITTDITIDYLIDLLTVNKLWYEIINTFVLQVYEDLNVHTNKLIVCSNSENDLIWGDNYLLIYMKNYSDTSLKNSIYVCRYIDTYIPISNVVKWNMTYERVKDINRFIDRTYNPLINKEKMPVRFQTKHMIEYRTIPLYYFNRMIIPIKPMDKVNILLIALAVRIDKIFTYTFTNKQLNKHYYGELFDIYNELYTGQIKPYKIEI